MDEQKMEHGALPILREEVERRQKRLNSKRDDIKDTAEEIKRNLDWLIREPNNLNPSARLRTSWSILGWGLDEIQQTAREISELNRAIAVLERQDAD